MREHHHKYQPILIVILLALSSLVCAADDGRTDSHLIRGYLDSRYLQLLDAYANPVVAEKEAAYLRNLYEALIKKGFSKDEALKIVIEHESPLAGALQ